MKNLFIALSCLAFQSCYVVSNQTRKEFDYCYAEEKTNIAELIDIKGYYQINIELENSKRSEAIIFLEDGIYIETPSIEFLANADKDGLWNKTGYRIGIYKISADTISAQYIYVGSATSGCEMVKYKILDSNTIRPIYYGNCDNPSKAFLDSVKVSEAKFFPYKDLPNSDILWIKNKVWFWCDKEAYKKWSRMR